MSNYNLKNIPDHIHRKLRLRAKKNHRSLNGELLAILEQALDGEGDNPDGAVGQRLATLRARCKGRLSLAETTRAIDEGRP